MKKLYLVLAFIVLISNCKKDDSQPVKPVVPAISSINPASGGPDTEVTISGSAFSSVLSDNVVKFNDVAASVTSATTSSLVVKVPISSGTGNITVTTPQGTANGPSFTYVPDVFVGGAEANSSGKFVVKYWKNGVANSITDGSTDSFAYSMALSGNDVFMTGYELKGTANVAKVWKNNTAISLTDGTHNASASSIALVGSDVYVAGSESNGIVSVAKYWKNGVGVAVTDGSKQAGASAIAVIGNDVYVAGYEAQPNGVTVAKYWKNGLSISLSDGSDNASAYSISVNGSDVYVAGYGSDFTNYFGQYWKNGVANNLGNNVTIDKILAVSNDVYLSGYNSGIAMYWKNGVSTSLNTDSKPAFAHSITVYGSDIYIGGNDFNGTVKVAKYWKNGVATNLTDGSFNAHAWSIVVR